MFLSKGPTLKLSQRNQSNTLVLGLRPWLHESMSSCIATLHTEYTAPSTHIFIRNYLLNTLCLQVSWVLCIMHWGCAPEGTNFFQASVLTHEEGSFKWHQINQKQTQSNTKPATKTFLLHIYFSKRCFFFCKIKGPS